MEKKRSLLQAGRNLTLFAACSLLALTSSISMAELADDPVPRSIPPGFKVKLVDVADGLTAPNLGVNVPGQDDLLMVSDQNGIIWLVDVTGSNNKMLFLDLSSQLVPLGVFGPGSFDERGLLGLAIHPLFQSNGLLYTYTSEPLGPTADFSSNASAPDHLAVITEFKVTNPADLSEGVPTARVLLRIEEPQFNHNGGSVVFGPDDMLYISLGDGGSENDVGDGHSDPQGNGQDTSNVLGTILRIDPLSDNAANGQYGIPEDNPFAPKNSPAGGQAGCLDGICDEIFAYGLRNPFRISFDSKRGTLLAGDVGQEFVEEINVIKPGGNYGWNIKEGPFCFDPSDGSISAPDNCQSQGLRDPNALYDQDEGISVIGGFVYRGTAIPELRGRFVFGDFSRAIVFDPEFGFLDGRLFYLQKKNLRKNQSSMIKELRPISPSAETPFLVLGFGQDADGELYVMGNSTGTPFGDSGFVKKIVKHKYRE